MNGVHDMGGAHGYGAVEPGDAEPFHDDWERRVFGITLAAGGHLRSNLDRGRYELEMLPPRDYLAGYFERWFARLLKAGAALGFIDDAARAAIDSGQAPPSVSRDHEPLPAAALRRVARSGRPVSRTIERPATFAVGDTVRARNIHPPTHTRLPRYVRGKTGTVVAWHGAHVFPDSNAEQEGENPQHLYSVRFQATVLWGPDAPARDSVILDLFEPYLEAPA